MNEAKMSISTTQPPAPPDTRNKGGRPSCRTPEVAKVICDVVSLGVPYRHACSVAKISYQTFCDWRKDDENFCEQVEAALAEGVRRRLQVIEAALQSQDEAIRLRASCWWLEHRLPEHFSKSRVGVTGADGAPLAGAVAIYLPVKEPMPADKPIVEAGGNGETKAIAERSGEDEPD